MCEEGCEGDHFSKSNFLITLLTKEDNGGVGKVQEMDEDVRGLLQF
jgi:hypothetical protein